MENNDTELGRTEILSTPPAPLANTLPDFDPDTPRDLIRVEDAEDLLEDLVVRLYMRTLADPTVSSKDALRCAKDAATMIGKAGGQQKVTVVHAENAQINNLNENTELLSHLRKAATGLNDLTSASEADIVVSRGGQGA